MPITDKLKAVLGADAEKYTTELSAIDEEHTALAKRFATAEQTAKDANSESAERRRVIRDELKPKIEKLEDENHNLKKQIEGFDNSEEKNRIQELEQQNADLIVSAKDSFKSELLKVAKHAKFNKVSRSKFNNLPLDDDGNLLEDKLDEMPNEEILKNRNVLSELRQIDYFEDETPGAPIIPPGGGSPNPSGELLEQYKNEKDPRKRDQLAQKIMGNA